MPAIITDGKVVEATFTIRMPEGLTSPGRRSDVA